MKEHLSELQCSWEVYQESVFERTKVVLNTPSPLPSTMVLLVPLVHSGSTLIQLGPLRITTLRKLWTKVDQGGPGGLVRAPSSGKCFLVDQGDPERPWSTTQHHGPAGAPGPLLVRLDPAWSTSCNHTPEIADQGG